MPTTISPDLTQNDPKMMGDSGGLTVDNLSVEYAGVVFALAESPLEKGQIWAGTNDGRLQLTRDGGQTWTDVSKGLVGLPSNGTYSSIEPSRLRGEQPGGEIQRSSSATFSISRLSRRWATQPATPTPMGKRM